ncbi:MAG: RNA polymerase sigma factor [Anderseniella sp.]
MLPPAALERTIDRTVREEWGRILACLVKTVGDLQLAEDSLQDAVVSAMNHWQKNGLPNSPAAWLLTAARRKAIDRLRRDRSFASRQDEIAYLAELDIQTHDDGAEIIPDKRLEMIFTCCHPALAEKTRVALTLRTLGGLTTEEIAHAFLDKPETMAQRLVRAKSKISLAGIPYRIPDSDVLPERTASVLSVIYLIFNEGYAASAGDRLTRTALIEEAIRLARIVRQLMPDDTEVSGLLALMLLHDARRVARTGKQGELVPLEKQNRARWDKAKFTEGAAILKQVLSRQRPGPYQLQAAISAVHAQSPSWAATDWPQIAALYSLLYAIQPSPVVRINQAVAVSYARSPQAALTMLDEAALNGGLDAYQPYFAARADVLARAGKTEDARECFATAIDLSDNNMEKTFLRDKVATL